MTAARTTAWFTMLIILSQLAIACGGDGNLPAAGDPRPQEQPGFAYAASSQATYPVDPKYRFRPPAASIPIRLGALPEPFSGRAGTLTETFTGALLAGPRVAGDGQQEIIFENLVLVVDRASPDGVSPRPLPAAVGIQSQPLTGRLADPLMVFYPLKGDLGHNVPLFFVDYLERHGGLGTSGLPISEVNEAEPGLYRQCFTNLCLDFDLNAMAGDQLSLAPLGGMYLERAEEQQVSFAQSQSLEGVDLQIWEGRTFVSSNEAQEVHVAVFEDGLPLKNREPVLSLALPDGSQVTYHFPPTGEDGLASLVLPEIAASSGTLIAYQVCLSGLAGEQTCAGDNFMIWNHP